MDSTVAIVLMAIVAFLLIVVGVLAIWRAPTVAAVVLGVIFLGLFGYYAWDFCVTQVDNDLLMYFIFAFFCVMALSLIALLLLPEWAAAGKYWISMVAILSTLGLFACLVAQNYFASGVSADDSLPTMLFASVGLFSALLLCAEVQRVQGGSNGMLSGLPDWSRRYFPTY
jgi:hypothetical protein